MHNMMRSMSIDEQEEQEELQIVQMPKEKTEWLIT